MAISELTVEQLNLIHQPIDAKIFLQGPAGSGKTTAAVERLLHMMASGVPGESILLLVPQRTLAEPYYNALHAPGVVAGGMVTVLTVGGLAQRMVELFWPLIAAEAGFAHPDKLPTFLTLETAQYYMAFIVRPLLEQGYFESVTIERNRLYSQIIDNLNKAAAVGFAHTEIAERLQDATTGEAGQIHVYEDAQKSAEAFREFCLEHNLLDFSLQLEVFLQYLWTAPLCREYLIDTYRNIFFDNIEEDTPVAHDLLLDWIPECDSATLIFDRDAGYRRFLGADPESAERLLGICDTQIAFESTLVSSASVQALGQQLGEILAPDQTRRIIGESKTRDAAEAIEFEFHAFHPQMLDWVAGRIERLIREDGVPPGEIVVLSPYLSDALRFSLDVRLSGLGIPSRSHRPSRSLREEPVTECMLTLAALAHPSWEMAPNRFDFAYALVQAISGIDLIRAQLLTSSVFPDDPEDKGLESFDSLGGELQERITYRIGRRYEALRLWLAEYVQGQPEEPDHFLSRLFGEVLSQPGYGFHADYSAGEVVANLIESVQKFRWVAGEPLELAGIPLGKEYLLMVRDGVIAAQYIRSWSHIDEETVLIAPAYTFLMSNRAVDYQFWLEAGSRGWFERLYQPLTHPYVLSRNWVRGRPWTSEDEFEAARQALRQLALGLTRRCRKKVFLGSSKLGEHGYEQTGPFLHALQRVLQQSRAA